MPTKPYDVREPDGWADGVAGFEQKLLDDGAVVVLYGDCPRCSHVMDVELPIADQTSGLVVSVERDAQALERPRRGRSKKRVSFTKTAHCNCRMDHEDRPKDVSEGCGAFGAIKVG